MWKVWGKRITLLIKSLKEKKTTKKKKKKKARLGSQIIDFKFNLKTYLQFSEQSFSF